jgi:DHA2 family multidrug resistance protein
MANHIMQGKIQMPLFRDFVPNFLRPWIYLFFAFVFQFSDTVYLASANHMVGTTLLTHEDVMMCGYFALVGVNMPFPLLFRLKFRFKNKQMLLACAICILLCNIISLFTCFMPLLCIMCYLAGFCKLWGTFECMSNIQLWLTPERDFSIFFPFLYILVLGDIQCSEFFGTYIDYYYSWQYMHYLMMALLLVVILILVTCTKMFHFMKKIPLYGVDWLGGLLWSALLLELIYICNYGEYYNWWDGTNIRVVAFAAVVTAYFCIGRMRHIRHPFISPAAWKYKKLWPMLALFFVSEVLAASPNVLQNILVENILHFDSLHTVIFSVLMFGGLVIGCFFTLLWVNRLHLSYVRLLFIGFAALVLYHFCMYFLVSPELNIEKLYVLTILRNFGYAIVFCALTIYLEEMMPFEHFFHGLFIVGIIRTGLGAAFGTALYSFAMRYHVAYNTVRYGIVGGSDFLQQVTMISIKQLYGLTTLFGTGFILFLLLFDVAPFRRTLKKMPYWNVLGRKMKKELKTVSSSEREGD